MELDIKQDFNIQLESTFLFLKRFYMLQIVTIIKSRKWISVNQAKKWVLNHGLESLILVTLVSLMENNLNSMSQMVSGHGIQKER